MEGKWIARQALNPRSYKGKTKQEHDRNETFMKDVDGHSELENKHAMKVEGPDDTKFERKKKRQKRTNHSRVHTCRGCRVLQDNCIRRLKCGLTGIEDAGRRTTRTHADRESRKARRWEGTRGLEVQSEPRTCIYEEKRRAAEISASKLVLTDRRLIVCGGEPISL